MHSSTVKKAILFTLCSICISGICTFLTWLFMFLCKAEGETLYLLVWVAISSILIYLVYGLKINPNLKTRTQSLLKKISLVLKVLTILITGFGVIVVLLQLGATQRSYAEAWFEYTRTKGPYGFFSFFASEIYAFLLLISVVSFAKKRYITGICIVLAVNALCVGIIFNKQYCLLLTVLFLLIPLIVQNKWQNLIVPFTVTMALSMLISFIEIKQNKNISGDIFIDTSAIVSRIAPDFPLLSSVPGYGYDIGTTKMVSSVYLSPHRVLKVSGIPLEVVYLTTSKSNLWNGQNWSNYYSNEDKNKVDIIYGTDSMEAVNAHRFNGKTVVDSSLTKTPVTIQVLEDFYSIIPCTLETYAVRFPESLKDIEVTEDIDKVLSMERAFTKNSTFVLYRTRTPSSNEDDFSSSLSSLKEMSTFAKIPVKIKNLSIEIMQQARQLGGDEEMIKRRYIQLVLNYFLDGFTYSLQSPQAKDDVDPFEYFLFETKTGFCTWYAGSFTLLMQAQDIPCRIAEGFRVILDEYGQGAATGIQAHAWSEVFIDGAWRIFEATPIFSTENPFAYVQENDKNTLKQLSRLFDEENPFENSEVDGNNLQSINYKRLIVYITVIAVICIVILLIFLRLKASLFNVYRLKRAVKQYHRKGVLLPSETGWLLWKESIQILAQSAIEREKAIKICGLVDEIIERTYRV